MQLVVRGKDRMGRVTTKASLEFGYADAVGLGVMARICGVAKKTVSRKQKLCGMVYWSWQALFLGRLCQEFCANPPSIFVCRVGWDETGELLRFKCRTGERSAPVSSSKWEVMIIRFTIMWCFTDDPDEKPCVLHIMCPPLGLTSVTAPQLWYALRCHPWTRPIIFAIYKLMAQATHFRFMLFETDDASNNQKVEAQILQ